MRQLPSRWKKAIVIIGLISILTFGWLIFSYLRAVYKDTPQAPCYASIDFVHVDEGNVIWHGQGDMTIDLKEGAFYTYYTIKGPKGESYVYDRKFNLSVNKLDTSRFFFKTSSISTFEGDTSGADVPFMARGFQGGLITFSYFSDFEYYFNVNNLVIGVCHVPR